MRTRDGSLLFPLLGQHLGILHHYILPFPHSQHTDRHTLQYPDGRHPRWGLHAAATTGQTAWCGSVLLDEHDPVRSVSPAHLARPPTGAGRPEAVRPKGHRCTTFLHMTKPGRTRTSAMEGRWRKRHRALPTATPRVCTVLISRRRVSAGNSRTAQAHSSLSSRLPRPPRPTSSMLFRGARAGASSLIPSVPIPAFSSTIQVTGSWV